LIEQSSKQAAAKITVVDDDEAALDSFAVLLELGGFEVRTFEDSQRFLAAFPSLTSDCILLDVRMPNIDGIAVLQRLNAVEGPPPVILMTASPKLLSQRRARRLGALMVLEKPIEEASLMSAVRMAIAHQGQSNRRIRENTYRYFPG